MEFNTALDILDIDPTFKDKNVFNEQQAFTMPFLL